MELLLIYAVSFGCDDSEVISFRNLIHVWGIS
jgi:hypothetical protein